MSHAGHGVRLCQYDQDHGRCRCPDGTAIIRVQCDQPRIHAEMYRERLQQEGPGGPSGVAYQPTKAEIDKTLKVGLDPAHLPGIIATEAEIERQQENERAMIWEAGAKAAFRNSNMVGAPLSERIKNPYQWHGEGAPGQDLPSPYRIIERIQCGELDRYLERIISAAYLRKAQL